MRQQPRDTSQPSLNPQAIEFIPSAGAGTAAAAAAGSSLGSNRPPSSSNNSAFGRRAAGGSVGTSSRHSNAAVGRRRAGRPNGENSLDHGRHSRQRRQRQGPESGVNRRRQTQSGDHISAAAATSATATGEPSYWRERPRQGRHGGRSEVGRSSQHSIETPSKVPQSQDGRSFASRNSMRDSERAATNQATQENDSVVRQQMTATASTPVGEARPRATGNQRRRRPHDRRLDAVHGEINGAAPLPPYERQEARGMEPLASSSSRSAAGRPRPRARGGSLSRVEMGLSETVRTAIPDRSSSISLVARGQERADVRFEGKGSGVSHPESEFEGGVKDQEESFPALPQASGPKQGSGEASPPLSLALEATKKGSVGLSYSSLAERLAAEAAAAAATEAAGAKSSGGGCTTGESFSRLSVLPSFEGGRGAKVGHRDARGKTPQEAPEYLATSSPALTPPPPDRAVGETVEQPRLMPPLAPSQPPLADGNVSRKMGARASAETVALRARLRERWFRLEATRKAQRQREAAEKELMAAEDDAVYGGDHKQRRNAASTSGHEDVGGQSGGVGDDGSSCGDRDSEGDGATSSTGETDHGGRPTSPHLTSGGVVGVPEANAAADRSSQANLTSGVHCEKDSGVSCVRGSGQSREVSAAGLAAIRRSEAVDATSMEAETVIRPGAPSSAMQGMSGSMDSEELEGVDPVASPLGQDESDKPLLVPSEGQSAGCGGAVEAVLGEGERVNAACESGMAGLLNDLLVRSAGRAADGKDKLRRTPLHLAAEAGSLECVNLLLKQGTRLDQRDRWRETPLHKAARSGNSDIVKALCIARMKVNIRNRHRETPLLLAVRANSAETASALLGFGARLDDPDVNGVTPVVQAAMSGQTDLLMAMANSNQAWKSSNREEPTPYTMVDVVDPSNRNRSSTVGKRRALPPPLYRGSANGGKGGVKGNSAPARALSPVHEAAASGRTETLSLLLQLGAALEERDSAAGVEGDTPLGRAVRAGQGACARLLLDAGAMIGRENARGETPLVIAIRAGQASAAELLVQHGAALDGGRSHNRLTAADGRAPAGAREKMLARRRVEPLELALREGQLACAAVLIECGARISERALKAVKLEPAGAIASDKSVTQPKQTRYAGTSPSDNHLSNTWNSHGSAGIGGATGATIPLQTDIVQCMSAEITEVADASRPDGGGLQEDPQYGEFAAQEGASFGSCGCREDGQSRRVEGCVEEGTKTARGANSRSHVKRVGGLVSAFGEPDIDLVLEDGSRLPVHSCLLVAFGGAFRNLILRPRGDRCRVKDRAQAVQGGTSSKRRSVGTSADADPPSGEAPVSEVESIAIGDDADDVEQRIRSRDVEPLLAGIQEAPSDGRPQASASTSAAAVAAAAFAATSIAEQTAGQPPAVVYWGSKRGQVCVRFWGQGTMAAVVQHLYSGNAPSDLHVNGLGRLLVAAVSLRMPRLMRQVEHLLSASLSSQKSSTRAAQHAEAARLLRAARVLRAKDLEDRCTLYLQENGVFPAVMKLRRELRVPSLHASDVTRGLARLKGTGYLGSGPAHAWSSSGAVSTASASDAVTAAKRAVDLSLRKRAVDFDQLVPLLLDPNRCASTLSIGQPERAILLEAALADACPRNHLGIPRGLDEAAPEVASTPHQRQLSSRRRRGCCKVPDRFRGESRQERVAVPLVSNFSAFSHDMGALLRTGALADVVLVLPERLDSSGTVDQAAETSNAGGRMTEEASGRNGEDVLEQDERKRLAALSACHGGATTGVRSSNRFLAHSMILGSRSEKFAAMLRFVRRQDAGCGLGSDGSSSESDPPVDDDKTRGETQGWRKKNISADDEQVYSKGGVEQQDFAMHDEADKDGVAPSSLHSGNHRLSGQGYHMQPCCLRVRRDPAPREMELQSPLLSPRSLGLFLEFLYTGVLIPSLSARELSELALIADEYLVPDLTRQAEALLVECLTSPNADGSSRFTSSMGQTTGSSADVNQSRREDDTASTPLEVLQLGISLGLAELSAAAARSVLLHLDTVSRSEAFETSGMSKRELVVAALEAIRS